MGILAGRLSGVDVRKHGSGNIGATNVLRVFGKKWGFAVFFADALERLCRGSARGLARQRGRPETRSELRRVLRDLWRRLLASPAIRSRSGSRFKGGKGVATSAGALFGVMPIAAVLDLPRLVGGLLTTRYVSARIDRRRDRFADRRRDPGAAELHTRVCLALFLHRDGGARRLAAPLEYFSSSERNRTTLRAEVNFKRTAVLGAGGWGTALAVLWAKRGNDVVLWGHNRRARGATAADAGERRLPARRQAAASRSTSRAICAIARVRS